VEGDILIFDSLSLEMVRHPQIIFLSANASYSRK
jgi:hypothetical protein